jgi:predicted dehydrogenase
MSPLRIGTLSHAHGHINTYCKEMLNFDDVELVAVWDDVEVRGTKAASDFNMTFRSQAEDVISDPEIDAVMIGCETNRHAEYVERAAEAGKHILLQKPMATSLADSDRIIDVVRRTGIKFSVAFQMRQDPVNQRIKALVEEGVIGNLAVVRRRHCIPVLLNPSFFEGLSKWHVDAEANVGMFFDDATHAADWFLWTFGMPVSVTAEIDNVVTDIASDDNGVAIYRFESGMIGILFNSSTTIAGVNTTEMYGDKGTLIQDYGDAPSTSAPRPPNAKPLRYIRQDDSEWTEIDLPIPASQGERIAAIPRPFVDYIKGITEEHVSAEEGRKSVEMVLGAYASAASGERTTFPYGG